MSNALAFLELATGRVVEGAPPPSGFFVRGNFISGRFVPHGDVVEGTGDLGDSGAPGWLELADGSFHGDQTARPPAPPFVRGVQAASGEFHPSSLEVVR